MSHQKRPIRQTGSTLIEVLVTIAISSVGLLGMAGLMIVSQRVNNDAYFRTQVNFIAQSLIESMHVNPLAVTAGAYNGQSSGQPQGDAGCLAHGCTPAERAEYDRARFAASLRSALPNATSSLTCTNAPGVPTSPRAVYDGLCRLEIAWSGRALTSAGNTSPQSSVWIFQP